MIILEKDSKVVATVEAEAAAVRVIRFVLKLNVYN
jgi:hypothetical protein